MKCSSTGAGTIRTSRGFTLLELLIVIIIIAVLVGMIFPVLGNLREKARNVQCKNNLKQLQVAATSYAYDHGGSLPTSRNGTSNWRDNRHVDWYETGSIGWISWTNFPTGVHHSHPSPVGQSPWWGDVGVDIIKRGTLWGYTGKSLKIYFCPAFERIVYSDPTGNPINSGNEIVRSYVMNTQASSKNIKNTAISKFVLFADAGITNALGGNTIADRNFLDNNKWAYDGQLNGAGSGGGAYPVESVGIYHSGNGNAVFIDGHVEQLTWKDTTDACSGNW